MIIKRYFSFLIFIGLLISVCKGQSEQDTFDFGTLEDNIYSNSFFDFKMTLPSGWIVQSEEEMKKIMEEGRKLVAGDDSNLEQVIKAAEINTANLFTVYQFELGAAVEYNPSLMVVTENLKNAPGVKTGADYLFHARKLLAQAQVRYDHIDDQFQEIVFGGKSFYLMNTEINYLGLDIKQKYYSTVYKGFSLNMIISYVTEDQESELEKSIGSLSFEYKL